MNDKVIYESTKRITQNYGGQSNKSFHNGVDLGYRKDENQNKVYANCKGKVVEVQDNLGTLVGATGKKSWGNFVLIKHNNGMYSRYAHLKKGIFVSVGQSVDETTLLGIIGDSGNAYARHLHFEVATGYSSLTRIDPTPYLTKDISIESDSSFIMHIVKPGDTLTSIVLMYGVSLKELLKYNHLSNPNLIFSGDKIVIPKDKKTLKKYIVQEGDTLSFVARKHNTTWQAIYEKNKNLIVSTAKSHGVTSNFQNYLYAGQILII